MQYILTQQEYDKLLSKSDQTSKDTINLLRLNNIRLRAELLELQDKYSRLLIFGVSTTNEKLKDNRCRELF
jgi:transcriptional regulatory protein LevR